MNFALSREVVFSSSTQRSLVERWIKSAPAACHRYDGCMFLPICRTLEDPGVIASEFHEEQWDLIEMGRKPL